MPQRYFAEPYRFVPPYPSTAWCRVLWPLCGYNFRFTERVRRFSIRGGQHLTDAVAANTGILIAPNHSRWTDATVMGWAGVKLGHYFHYVVSAHMFRSSRARAWVLNRTGSFSILREGSDLESIKACVGILSNSPRPLVLFPEGTWFRTNERLGPLQDGTALIARQAAKAAERPVVVLPTAIKYWLIDDPTAELNRRLGRLESRFRLRPRDLGWVERCERVLAAFLAVKEIDWLGEPRPGTPEHRIQQLVLGYIERVEGRYTDEPRTGHPLERVRWLRQRLVRRLQEAPPWAEQCELREVLDDLLLCENLDAHRGDYLRSKPSPERVAESVERLGETILDAPERPVTSTGVVVEFGDPLTVADYPKKRGPDGDPLMRELAGRIQAMLDRLAAEPPYATWRNHWPSQP